MAVKHQAVQWNGNKIVYDFIMLLSLAAFVAVFIFVGLQTFPNGHVADPVVLMIRALGCASFLMLTVALAIGPLARLTPRFLPLLYNRRHLGVMTFLVSAAHFALALIWYHGGGPLNPFVSLLVSNPNFESFSGFPFEIFGLAAFAILYVMAATSHDFWLKALSPTAWKIIHMLVYVAYGLLVLHIAYGALMTEKSSLYAILVVMAFLVLFSLHLAAGFNEWSRDSGMKGLKAPDGWIDVCAPEDIPDKRAVIAPLPQGDRVAVFRDGAHIFAVENACRHQNGPLGEGCIKDGFITCPWHGWQYRPEDGVSPPPFEERIATHDVKRSGTGRVFVSIRKNALGVPGAKIDLGEARS